MRKVRMAVIGLGSRGSWWLGELLKMEDVEVTAVCDQYEDRLEQGRGACEERYGHPVFGSVDYRDIVGRSDNEAVLIATYWNDHIRMSIAAMKEGKYVASEVGPAQSIRQCWDLVRTYEETGVPFMLMENCCYNREEMTVLNMVKKGLFGELIHCQGGYEHDLRALCHNWERDHAYRWQDEHRNAELYPTHELGPIMTYLNINRGNRLLSLSAMASKARGLHKYALDHPDGAPSEPNAENYKLGDIITTTIRCANGETIVLTHDTCSPRPYSRGGRVQGTCGLWMEDLKSVHIEGRSESHSWEPMENYWDEFEHPLWKKTRAADFTGGHGGMDWLVMRAFLDAVRRRIQTPIDVYDSVTMMATAILSEESIALGCAPVAFPDFTDGMWIKREPAPKSIFSLAEVDDSLFEGKVEF